MDRKQALKLAKKIVSNLKGRSGMWELDDDEIEKEILDEIAEIILQGFNKK
jgi:hypothetical protein